MKFVFARNFHTITDYTHAEKNRVIVIKAVWQRSLAKCHSLIVISRDRVSTLSDRQLVQYMILVRTLRQPVTV